MEAEETRDEDGERDGDRSVVDQPESRLDLRTVRWMVASVVVLFVGRFVPMPGVDYHTLAASRAAVGLEAWLTPLPLVGSTVPLIATIQLVLILLGRGTNPNAQRVAAAIYLALGSLSGFAVALYAEGLDYSMSPFPDFVHDPGWGFRAMSALSWTAGAAIVWWLASALDRSRRVHGALFLMLITTLGAHTFDSVVVGAAVASGSEGSGILVAWITLPLCVFAVALVMWMRPVASWPVKLHRWPLRSSWDGLSLVLLTAVPKSAFASWWNIFERDAPLPTWVTWIDAFIAAAVAARVVIFWWNTGRPGEGFRPVMALMFASLFVATVSSLLFVGFVRAGGLEARSRMPLEGSRSFILVLEAEDRFAPSDADAMVTRLAELGAESVITEQTASSITLRVTNAIEVDAVLEALAPNALSVHLAGDVLRDGDPSLAALDLLPGPHTVARDPSIGLSAEGDCTALLRWRETAADDARCLYRVQTPYPNDALCTLHCLRPPPVLTNQDILEARVVTNEWDDKPAVAIVLDLEGTRRFEEVTHSSVGHRLAIVLNDVVVAAPIIREPIRGGMVQISLGHFDSAEQALSEAEAVAASLQPGSRIESRWTLVHVE